MEHNVKKQFGVNLADSSMSRYEGRFSFQLALGRGAIVDVTTWTSSAMGFARAGATVRVGITANLWNAMVKSCVNDAQSEVIEGEESDVLYLAQAALKRAKEKGESAANFYALLMQRNERIEAQQMLRVESKEDEKGSVYVVIGFPEDVLGL